MSFKMLIVWSYIMIINFKYDTDYTMIRKLGRQHEKLDMKLKQKQYLRMTPNL